MNKKVVLKMFIGDVEQTSAIKVSNPEAFKATMKVLIGPGEGWDSHVMRLFELEAGGFTPKHSHPWPHINLVFEGTGTLFSHGEDKPIHRGTTAFIAPDDMHQFKNNSDSKLVFLCIVPKEGHK
jgi:quercetin dioxygenase-like cupin family protein